MKTAAELGIEDGELAALIATKAVLAAEQIGFDMTETCDLPMEGRGFDRKPVPAAPCGSLCCIGGAMSLIMQGDGKLPDRITPEMAHQAHTYVMTNQDGPFSELFFGYSDATIAANRLTPADGIKAIDRFLEGEERPWLGL